MPFLSLPAADSRPLSRAALWLCGLLLITLLWDVSGLDLSVMQAIGDPQGFALRHQWLLERVLHDGVRQAMTLAFVLLVVWVLWPRLDLPRRDRLAVVAVVLLSLLAVNLIKNKSLTSCPWELQDFGGAAQYVSHWARGLADGGGGRCFPGGHASSGFAFLALSLPWLAPPAGAARRRDIGRRWLATTLAIGLVAGVVQTVRGAHYPSHTLWTLLICGSVSVAAWGAFRAFEPGRRGAGRAHRPPSLRNLLRVLRPVLLPMLAMLAVLWLSRIGLALWQSPRIVEVQAWGLVLRQGLRFDGVLLGLLWTLPAAITPWMALHPASARAWGRFLWAYGLLALLLLAFMELSTPAFIAQYDSRPNYLFVEYLGYAKEVGGTLVKDYWAHLLAALVLLPALALGYGRLSRPDPAPALLPLWQAVPLSVLLLLSLAIAGRGSLGHRPANPASAALTADHLVNELPLNSLYTLMYAIYQARKSEAGITYAEMPRAQVLDTVRRETGLPAEAFTDQDRPTRHHRASLHPRARPLNLVIVLEESLGAEFVGRMGGLPLTPNLDRLADEGIWFERLYATGTRSVRGIEAVVAGFPPTSAVSTVKLAKSQRDFFTLASFLKPHGYESTFYYGGESHFDNMRSYFMGNGFDRVVEQKDMPRDAFIGTWGASDGDLFDVAHRAFEAQPADKPFFALVFTSSNHAPFEFPEAPFTLHEQPRATVNNAVKYADHALGHFFEQARRSRYWDNTLFLVVADHNSRVYGPSLVPIERFHIPGLILGGPVKQPQRITTVASQIDLAPTLVSLMGLSGERPWIGRDLSDPAQQQRPGRAIMQFDKTQAYMEGSDVAVLQPDTSARTMRYEQGQLRDNPVANPALIEKAQAHARFAQWAYQEGWHR
ncbi:sulfatase-like hydrolase/transferase [Hydrogenophaga sp. T2]|uniref:sulfatase-like hydrolase/transferase n=1 Tax=Hydrogenophaga sp. T2 TaxID=3132823 RepID=UPI003CE9FDDE